MTIRTISEQEFETMRGRVRSGVVGTRLCSAGSMVAGRRTHPALISKAGSNPASSPYKSNLENAFAYKLTLEKHAGIIANFWYEPLNLRLPGGKNFYKPDFLVLAGDGLTFYEVKGRNQSDDRSLVKLKTAAGLTPWARFVLVKRIHGQWEERAIV